MTAGGRGPRFAGAARWAGKRFSAQNTPGEGGGQSSSSGVAVSEYLCNADVFRLGCVAHRFCSEAGQKSQDTPAKKCSRLVKRKNSVFPKPCTQCFPGVFVWVFVNDGRSHLYTDHYRQNGATDLGYTRSPLGSPCLPCRRKEPEYRSEEIPPEGVSPCLPPA